MVLFVGEAHRALHFSRGINEEPQRVTRQRVVVTAGRDELELPGFVIAPLGVAAAEQEALDLIGREASGAVLGEQLRELGFLVDEAADGISAIEQLKSNGSYDVLLTDFAMPGMNGLDTIRKARDERPTLRALLMTGYADENAMAHVRENVPIIRKPINVRDLLGHLA